MNPSSLPIRDTKPFSDPDDWRRMLATMPEPALLATMAAKSQVMDLQRLTLMVDGGLLDIRAQIAQIDSLDDAEDLMDEWAGRLTAFTGFMSGITLTPITHSPVYGELQAPAEIAVFNASNEMKSLYADASESIANNYQSLIEHPLGKNHDRLPELHEALGQWLSGAIVLDLPLVVKDLVGSMPDAANTLFPMNCLGRQITGLAQSGDNQIRPSECRFLITAPMVAMALSREHCLDALWSSGVPVQSAAASRKLPTQRPEMSHASEVFFSFLKPTCLPETLAKVLKKEIDDPADQAEMTDKRYDMAIGCMSSILHASSKAYAPYAPSFIDAGVYRKNPEMSLGNALVHDFPGVVDSVKDLIAWDEKTLKRMTGIIEDASEIIANDAEKSDRMDQSMLKVMNIGIEAGHSDHVFSTYVNEDWHSSSALGRLERLGRLEPLFSFVDEELHHAVVKFLEHGFDSQAKLGNAPSLIEYASENSPKTAHVIRSFEARQQALGALREIEPTGMKP